MFWDAAGNTVSSTATLCDSEALGILGFTFGTGQHKEKKKQMLTQDKNYINKNIKKAISAFVSAHPPESGVRLDGLQYLSQEA